ncbi:hypothetical protein O4H49_10125 [Kiloniella laminariae]|uniref:Secreted protein n=1 Tax=Kiloniella laminariae TaxID=454162 RepID=A0ABT4LJ52_9PROT|nr:hypothetical protein [Kiloniella laminariae]MCZ4281134.1 hypothetical protein [Kiloniella laminariae]
MRQGFLSKIKPWRQLAAAILLVFIPVAAVQAAGDSVIAQGGDGEVFFAALPEGWHALPRATEQQQTTAEWLPPGQHVENWTNMITVQVFPGWAGGDVDDFLNELAEIYGQNCEASGATPPLKDQVNGFPTGFRLINCTRDLTRNTGEVALFRATVGRNALYLIQHVFRVPEFEVGAQPVTENAMRAAFEGIRTGWACHKGSTQQSCPPEWLPVLSQLDGKPSVVVIRAPQ